MQKVVDFLEKYCQWVAVAVGAVFFLFALSQYLPVVTTPVSVELGGKQLGPGEVDREIVQNIAEPLEARMNDTGSTRITVNVPNYAAQIVERVSRTPDYAPLSGAMTATRSVEYPEIDWDVKPATEQGGNQLSLPELPVAILTPAPTTGFAQVSADAAQPGAAAPANPAAGKDVTWVRVPFSISVAQMDHAFRTANIPGALSNTNFVRVELLRQRKMPDGSWSAEEVVAPIGTVNIPPLPRSGDVNAQLSYNQWAIQNQQNIVQPPFFQIIAGDNPLSVPVTAEDTSLAGGGDPALGGIDPETFPQNRSLVGLTDAQRAAVLAVRQRRAKEAADARRNAGNTGGQPAGGGEGAYPGSGRGGGGGGGRGPRSDDGSNNGRGPVTPFQFQPRPGTGYPGEGYPRTGYPGEGYPSEEGLYPGQGQMNQVDLPPIPNQQFIPQSAQPDILGHAYDMTAKPGATYRYRIRYSIANPLFNAQIAGVPAAVVAQYELFGEDLSKSKWSEPITVKLNTHVFLQTTPSIASNLVRFTLFHWQNGKWNRSNQTFTPGDTIGKVDGEVDFSSLLTLVDVRRDSTSDSAYALVMSDDGSTTKRFFEEDKNSEELKRLNAEVDGPVVPPAYNPGREGYPGGGYPGGGYPGSGYPDGGGASGGMP